MNWDQLSGEWKQVQAQVKSKWAKLTDDDLKNLNAKKDMLIGKIQTRYGVLKDEAERQVDEWMASMPDASSGATSSPDTKASPNQVDRAKRA